MRPTRRLPIAALGALLGALAGAAPADAHPLGNFSINHLTTVTISRDRVDLRYILDQAEIPTFQQRGTASSALLARTRAEVLRALVLTIDGRRAHLRPRPGASISFPPGQGGLRLTRIVLPLSATIRMPARITLHDGTFADRLGWKAIVSRPGTGTAVRTNAPSGDPTNELRRYPADLLTSPLEQRNAAFTARPGTGTLTAPPTAGAHATTTTNRAGDRLIGAFERAAAGHGVLAVFLLAAFAWGAVHALSPGHGKAMVAAYLVGIRGTPRHALALGITVTVTHTAGVFALGLVTLLLSHYVLPERLYPWLNLLAGVLVLGIGATVLRTRLRQPPRSTPRAHHHAHGDEHHHDHSGRHDDSHRHDHDHSHHHDHGHRHNHAHGHRHELPERITWRSVIAAGAAAGLIPCPSALVVLLAAIAQQQIPLGLLLIVAFSLGLAGTLTALGLVVVSARRLAVRIDASARAIAALPAASALLICGVGCLLTLRALQQLP